MLVNVGVVRPLHGILDLSKQVPFAHLPEQEIERPLKRAWRSTPKARTAVHHDLYGRAYRVAALRDASSNPASRIVATLTEAHLRSTFI